MNILLLDDETILIFKHSELEKIPSDADSSDESEGSPQNNNITEQEEELDQSLSTVCGEEDEDWSPSNRDEN